MTNEKFAEEAYMKNLKNAGVSKEEFKERCEFGECCNGDIEANEECASERRSCVCEMAYSAKEQEKVAMKERKEDVEVRLNEYKYRLRKAKEERQFVDVLRMWVRECLTSLNVNSVEYVTWKNCANLLMKRFAQFPVTWMRREVRIIAMGRLLKALNGVRLKERLQEQSWERRRVITFLLKKSHLKTPKKTIISIKALFLYKLVLTLRRPLASNDRTYPSWSHPDRGAQIWEADWFCEEYDQHGPITGTKELALKGLRGCFSRRRLHGMLR
ncbi:hypothetical protein WN51_12527 [Melipona quadrifasciata]|uniref:Uncharacterized protein n=1 Tax=Melipona quadrifasciata TaxID=166423 RepID=A0A0M9A2N9_9HYME|nr:hypothetical protein WN51_12527 [Melipona quadrifasciata]